MSSGLDASTVTPGRTAPDASLTTPVMEAWANRAVGRASRQANANVIRTEGRMRFFSLVGHRRGPNATRYIL